jgi:hypothetical protein
MMTKFLCLVLCLALRLQSASSWSAPASHKSVKRCFGQTKSRSLSILNSVAVPVPDDAGLKSPVELPADATKEELKQQALKEGGLFTFTTRYGALNPYAIFYGVTSIFLGLFWYAALTVIQLLYTVTGGRVDKRVSSHVS